jgi:feruloyl-CoA synthase
MAHDIRAFPVRSAPYRPVDLQVTARADGELLLRHGAGIEGAFPHMLAPLAHWAENAPDTVWMAQRHTGKMGEGWAELTYAGAWDYIRPVATGLMDLRVGPGHRVMILSRNSIAHAVMMYGAMLAGAAVCPVTPAYSLLSKDHQRLAYVFGLLRPDAVFVEDGAEFAPALAALSRQPGWRGSLPVIYAKNKPADAGLTDVRAVSFWDLCETLIDDRVDEAYARLAPGLTAKIMLTSGSTSDPKAVINTHGMIATNVAMIRSVYDLATEAKQLEGGRPVMVNHLPWSHTLGGNAIQHYLTHAGGSLYIDSGAPTAAGLAQTVRNLTEVAPTQHTTVPAGWALLATALEGDAMLARSFFSRLRIMAYGGATMGQDIYERVQAVAVRTVGERITLSAGYGATETGPTCSNVHWPNERMGLIGLPVPGCEMKLVPTPEGKLELRVRGPHITPGYLSDPVATAAAFDDEGYYRIGDAVRFADPEDPTAGLAFDGRLGEAFKLASGSWVQVGKVRVDLLAAVDGALTDAVLCGEGGDVVAAIGFLNVPFCQRFVGASLEVAELAPHPAIRRLVALGVAKHNAAQPQTTARIARWTLAGDQPSMDAGELTDKGYINQRRAREVRAATVTALMAPLPGEGVEVG